MFKQKLKLLFLLFISASMFFISCGKTSTDSSIASIASLSCISSTYSAAATKNIAYTGMAYVPYTGGNGVNYSDGVAIASTGVTGLTATLIAGTLGMGAGSLNYNITGKATTSGTAIFPLNFGGQTCNMSIVVN